MNLEPQVGISTLILIGKITDLNYTKSTKISTSLLKSKHFAQNRKELNI